MKIFENSEFRVGWAREKLPQLKALSERLREDAFNRIIENSDPGVARRQVMDYALKNIPPDFIRLTSEAINHLRAALDYIPVALKRLSGTGSVDKNTYFPIQKSRQLFERNGKPQLKGIPEEYIALFERFQPYRRFDSLDLLFDLARRDKHHDLLKFGGFGIFPQANPTTKIEAASKVRVEFGGTIKILFYEGSPVIQTLEHLCSQVSLVIRDFKKSFDS